MAQIVTITNPLTGQPTQVDQLEHTAQQIDDAIARALPGGGIDTLLAGKAPAGYGLGEIIPATVSDPDTITKTGLYITSGDKLPSQLTYKGPCLIYHESYNSSYAFQEIKLLGATNGANHKGTRVCRYKENDVLGEWEWVNPPMELSVEYRTTERWNGKPVYKVALETGTLYIPGNTAVTGTWNANCTIIQVDAYILAADGSTTNLPSSETASDMRARCWVKPDGGFYVKTYSGLASGATAHAVISYVKN